MLDPELLAALPFALRAEIEENVTRKDFTQSELAEIQRIVIEHWSAVRRQRQGIRTDLLTSTQVAVEVARPKRFENTTQQVAQLFGESEHTTRKRLAIVDAAEAQPERFARLVQDMDRTGRVNGVWRRLANMQQAERIRAAPPPLPTGPYDVGTGDPPWPYEIRREDPSHRATTPYPQMSIRDICALPVASIMARDSVFWLWTTNHHLLAGEAVAVLRAWGFEPKTMLTWGKPSFGCGERLRGQTEHCILGVRGSPVLTLTNESTLLLAPKGKHSAKPDAFYALVEQLCPASRYVELFARKPRPGWVTWGDEVPRLAAE